MAVPAPPFSSFNPTNKKIEFNEVYNKRNLLGIDADKKKADVRKFFEQFGTPFDDDDQLDEQTYGKFLENFQKSKEQPAGSSVTFNIGRAEKNVIIGEMKQGATMTNTFA